MSVGSIGYADSYRMDPRDSRSAGISSPKEASATSEAAKADDAGKKSDKASDAMKKSVSKSELSAEEMKQIRELITTDTHVRAHEAAHMAAGGQYITGGVSYTYQTGPDGKRYAVGGEVGIDTSPERDPESTIGKMQVVRRAALAPADPSGADRSVAAAAAKQELSARMELARQKTEEQIAKLDEAKTKAESKDGESVEYAASRETIEADEVREKPAPSSLNAYAATPAKSRITIYA